MKSLNFIFLFILMTLTMRESSAQTTAPEEIFFGRAFKITYLVDPTYKGKPEDNKNRYKNAILDFAVNSKETGPLRYSGHPILIGEIQEVVIYENLDNNPGIKILHQSGIDIITMTGKAPFAGFLTKKELVYTDYQRGTLVRLPKPPGAIDEVDWTFVDGLTLVSIKTDTKAATYRVPTAGVPIKVSSEYFPFESDPLALAAQVRPLMGKDSFFGLKKTRGLSFDQYFTRFAEVLKNSVMGQPEAVDILLDVERASLINGGLRQVPEVAIFMGLPGTGKDTVIEEFLKAKHQTKYGTPPADVSRHLFITPILKESHEAATLTGSAPGLIGSEGLSAFNRFLVLHSGGRYAVKSTGKGDSPKFYVEENPYWKPGQVFEGYYAPEDAVVFVNELHDWSREMKNLFLKEAINKGQFQIADPGPGVSILHVPVNIFMASNDGIDLIAARDADGQRVGEPLRYEQLIERWKTNFDDKALLKEKLKASTVGNPKGGMSDEVVNRIPTSRIALLRPLSPEAVKSITRYKLNRLKTVYAAKKANGFPDLKLEFSQRLITFVSTYDQNDEDGGRVLNDKISSLIAKPLNDAIFSKRVQLTPGQKVALDVVAKSDGTFTLDINGEPVGIEYTRKELLKQPLTDVEIDRLNEIEKNLNRRVKGLEPIVAQIAKDIRRSKNTPASEKAADIYAFFGVSSTGKSELGVSIHRELYGTEGKPLVIDLGQVRDIQQLREKILGTRDDKNKPIASDFMRQYDRSNGDLVVMFDELDKAPLDIQFGLYDLLREKNMTTCSDGKLRPMGKVKIVMTGNIGESWYQNIPRDIPESEQWEAARSVYESAMKDPKYLRSYLTQFLSEAFLNRIGLHRVYFFPPHTYKTIRELIQLKLVSALKKMSLAGPGKRTWNVQFKTAQDYRETVEAIEKYGFKLWEQGASITNYVDNVLLTELNDLLIQNKVPAGHQVYLTKKENTESGDHSIVKFGVQAGSATYEFEVRGAPAERLIVQSVASKTLTSFHEMAHEFIRHLLLGEHTRPDGMSILPGTAQIGGEWVRYLGIAKSTATANPIGTRAHLIKQIAVMLAGEAAEIVVTKGGKHQWGVENDFQRASQLARQAVLRWGFSEEFGRMTIPSNQSEIEFVANLSAGEKEKLEKATVQIINEARELARSLLIANLGIFTTGGKYLAEKGTVTGAELERFYKDQSALIVREDQPDKIKMRVQRYREMIAAEAPAVHKSGVEFYSFVKKPSTVVDVENVRKKMISADANRASFSPGKAVTAPVQKAPSAIVKTRIPGKCASLF